MEKVGLHYSSLPLYILFITLPVLQHLLLLQAGFKKIIFTHWTQLNTYAEANALDVRGKFSTQVQDAPFIRRCLNVTVQCGR